MPNKNPRKISWNLLTESVRFLSRNKDLIILPTISVIFSMGVALGCVLASNSSAIKNYFHLHPKLWLLVAIILLMYYLVQQYLSYTLMATTILRLDGSSKSGIKDGCIICLKHTGTLLLWLIIDWTIGLNYRLFEESGHFITKIFGVFIEISWNICSIFAVPIILFQNLNPLKALQYSAHILVDIFKKDQTSIKGRFLTKIFINNEIITLKNLMSLLIVITVFIEMLIYYYTPDFHFFSPSNSSILIVLLFIIMPLLAALNSVVIGALYLNYIKKADFSGFDKTILQQAAKINS